MPVFFLLSFCCTGYRVRLPRLATVPRARSPHAASPCVPTPACSPRSHAVCALAPIGCRARSPRSCAHPSWLLYMSAVAPTHPVVVPCARSPQSATVPARPTTLPHARSAAVPCSATPAHPGQLPRHVQLHRAHPRRCAHSPLLHAMPHARPANARCCWRGN
jgi:hypothetical protein